MEDQESRQLKHMLLLLHYPAGFERIFGDIDRKKIVRSFMDLSHFQVIRLSSVKIARMLSDIRKESEVMYFPEKLDF